LPITVLRRLDCVLADKKEKVLARHAELRARKLEDLDPQLRKIAGFAFYNTSRYDFEKLLADAPHLAANLRNYIAGFSPNMREVLERFDFDNTISKPAINPHAEIHVFGQEVNPETWAVSKSDLFMKDPTGRDADNGVGDRAGTCIDPKVQVVQDKTVCVVSCQRSPEPVYLKWKLLEATPDDFFVRSGPGTVRLASDSAQKYVATRFSEAKNAP
jgi:type I restriction-modification system DNA methylase subunit